MANNGPSSRTKKSMDEQAIARRADWLAWLSQFLIGFFVGCAIGFKVSRMLVGRNPVERFLIAAGIGLICGAVTSYYGNKAWMAGSIFMPPESPPPSKARSCSIFSAGIGIATAVLTVARHIATEQHHHSPTAGLSIFFLVCACLPGFLAIRALRTGTCLWQFGAIDRDETPLFFWIYVLLNTFVCLGAVCMAF